MRKLALHTVHSKPMMLTPGDKSSFSPNTTAAGGGMGNLGLLEGYESNLGVDLRLLFMGDVPLSYSFEQSLGNIWSTQGGSSSPVQSELVMRRSPSCPPHSCVSAFGQTLQS
jgi:hypothetical protein